MMEQERNPLPTTNNAVEIEIRWSKNDAGNVPGSALECVQFILDQVEFYSKRDWDPLATRAADLAKQGSAFDSSWAAFLAKGANPTTPWADSKISCGPGAFVSLRLGGRGDRGVGQGPARGGGGGGGDGGPTPPRSPWPHQACPYDKNKPTWPISVTHIMSKTFFRKRRMVSCAVELAHQHAGGGGGGDGGGGGVEVVAVVMEAVVVAVVIKVAI